MKADSECLIDKNPGREYEEGQETKAGIFGCIVLLMFSSDRMWKDSEVQIVAPKEVKNEEDQTNHLGTDLKKQLEAPEKIQETLLENEKFVTIQAEVEVPEVSEILLKKWRKGRLPMKI